MTRVLRRLRGERGFTIVELMVACMVGSVVMLAIFMLLDTSVKQSSAVNSRVDSTKRGRTAMELITRELRSQVCFTIDATPSMSITDAQPYSVTFYAFHGSGTFVPDRRTISWDTNTNSLKESVAAGLPAAGPVTSFAAATTNTLATDVKPPPTPANTPVFAYYTTTGTALTSTPLSQADRMQVGIVRIRFQTDPATLVTSTASTNFDSQVFVRTADPNGLGGSTAPDCA
jgi:prepilin-type N-terminal cleavage/methylation domain-containing protein